MEEANLWTISPSLIRSGKEQWGRKLNTKLFKCLLALKFLYTCLRVLLPHLYTTGSSLVLLSEGKTGSFYYFFVWLQIQSYHGIFSLGVTCSPSGGYMGLKQLRQWHCKDPRGKKKSKTKSLRPPQSFDLPFFHSHSFPRSSPLSSPLLCKCGFCPVKFHGVWLPYSLFSICFVDPCNLRH